MAAVALKGFCLSTITGTIPISAATI
ncbi:unnamed protein product, partial [Rotaria sp. Silwood2]